MQPLVICYHAISDSWRDQLAVPARNLERHLRLLLRRGYGPATADEVLARRGRRIHVTFDDAFKSVSAAIPVLERLGVPATVFACPTYADDGRPLAVPELAAEAEAEPDELATMTWDELRELVERGFEIGSHTLTHAHLTQLSDADLSHELRASREAIEDALGRPCRLLAYPYGEQDARVRAAARTAGYEAAFGLAGGGREIDSYAVPRVGIWRKDGLLRATLKTFPAIRRAASVVPRRSRRRSSRR